MKSKLFSEYFIESPNRPKAVGKFSIHYGSKNSGKSLKKFKNIKEFALASQCKFQPTPLAPHRWSLGPSENLSKTIKMTEWEDMNSILSNIEKDKFPMLKIFNYGKTIPSHFHQIEAAVDKTGDYSKSEISEGEEAKIHLIEPLEEEHD